MTFKLKHMISLLSVDLIIAMSNPTTFRELIKYYHYDNGFIRQRLKDFIDAGLVEYIDGVRYNTKFQLTEKGQLLRNYFIEYKKLLESNINDRPV